MKYFYELKQETLDSYGTPYSAYGIFLRQDTGLIPIWHDVAREKKEAERICALLNRHDLEPEQAQYVIEDCILAAYFV